jgi:hypothetical protein
VLSNARTDKVTVALEAVETKIRQNSQGWEDAWIIGERQVSVVAAYKGQIYLLAEHPPAKFERIEETSLREAGYGLKTSNA